LFRSFCVCGKGDISREEAEDELLADATDVFWKGDKDAEAAVKTLVEKNRSLGETILKAIKSTVDKLNTLGKSAMNALKGELRGKWLEELGILEKAQEMWTNALVNPEVDEFEEAVDNGDGIKFMFKGQDSQGRDIYEISETTKNLTNKEKRNLAVNNIKELLGKKTIIFDNGSETAEAKLDKVFLKKNIYGDNQTNRKKVFKNKINIFADGDTMNLLSNAAYDSKSKDKDNKHKGAVKEWEYYNKEVWIDNNLFDVLINVQERSTGKYVYNVKFTQIKQNKSAPVATVKANANGLKSTGADSSTVNVSLKNSNVNGETKKYQRKNNIFDIPNNQQADISTIKELNKKIDALILNQTKTKGTMPKRSAVINYLKELISEVGSDVKAEELRIDYHNLYKAAKTGDNATKERLLNEITREIVKNTYETERISQEIQDVQRYLKNMTVSIDENLESEIKSRYGSFGKFKEYIDNAFKVKLSRNVNRMEYAVPVDIMLSEMNEIFGDTIKVDGQSLNDVTDFVTALSEIAEYASVKDNKVYLFDGGAQLAGYTEKEISDSKISKNISLSIVRQH
jgi:hypothetical protein